MHEAQVPSREHSSSKSVLNLKKFQGLLGRLYFFYKTIHVFKNISSTKFILDIFDATLL
jgi:hypothetical protein